MISNTEQRLYTQYKYWLDFYVINNFFYLIKLNYINLTYSNAIVFQQPTVFKYSLTKDKKRQLTLYLTHKYKHTNFYSFLKIINSFFIWTKDTKLTQLYGIINLHNYFLKLTNFQSLLQIKNFFFSMLKFKFNNFFWFALSKKLLTNKL